MHRKVFEVVVSRVRLMGARLRSLLRSRESIAAGVVVLALIVGPATVFGYARWKDRDVITVKAVQWAYLPETIYVKQGVTVRLRFISEDVVHGVVVGGPNPKVIQWLYPGKTEYVTFTAEKAGTYPFVCITYCALDHAKMLGQIIVTPSR